MKKSIRWSRFFESLIYFILLTIPMISVFARTIYVQSNPNAKDSYNGQIENSQTINLLEYLDGDTITSINYKTGYSYYENYSLNRYFYTLNFSGNSSLTEFIFNVSNFKLNGIEDNTVKAISISFGNTTTLYLNTFTINWTEETNKQTVYRWELNGNQYVSTHLNLNFNTNPIEFILTDSRIYSPDNSITLIKMDNLKYLFTTIIFYSGSLDNAFDYGLQKTIDDFGTGNINFLNWFGTMFSSNTNLLYINFVNMYLNYALWVSVGYLIYYFLTFFIKIIRNLVDGFIKKGESW